MASLLPRYTHGQPVAGSVVVALRDVGGASTISVPQYSISGLSVGLCVEKCILQNAAESSSHFSIVDVNVKLPQC